MKIGAEGRVYQEPSDVLVWFTKIFLFFVFFHVGLKHVGHEQTFIHPKYASNYASLTMWRTPCLHCQVSGWQDMKAMPLCHVSFCLRLPLSHIFGTIIPLFSSAVWSCFTPVQPHWLPFCPIHPLWYVFVSSIMTGRKWLSTLEPSCHYDASNAVQHLTPVYSNFFIYCFPAVSREQCKSGGLPFTLTDAQYCTMAPCCTCAWPAKRGITAQ